MCQKSKTDYLDLRLHCRHSQDDAAWIEEPGSGSTQRAAGGADVGAAGKAPCHGLSQVAPQGVAEGVEFRRVRGGVAAGRVPDVDQVEPDRGVATSRPSARASSSETFTPPMQT